MKNSKMMKGGGSKAVLTFSKKTSIFGSSVVPNINIVNSLVGHLRVGFEGASPKLKDTNFMHSNYVKSEASRQNQQIFRTW